MKVLDYTIDLNRTPIPEAERRALDPKQMFENYVCNCLNSIYNGQIDNTKQRTLGRLLDILWDTTSTSNCIILEEREFELVKEAFCDDRVKMDAKLARVLSLYRRNVERAETIAPTKIKEEESCSEK